ncbi:MAG: flavodoxin family protein [Proteobacteria bacterium]|nr:flavodoxin family protein [Pseudomonadota bacterium]
MVKQIKIAIVYFSGYNHTHAVAERVMKGMQKESGVEVTMYHVKDALKTKEELEQLNDCDAIVFGSPTYMGSLSSVLKEFMERTSRIWDRQQWRDKIAAGFTNSGGMSGDKLDTLYSMVTFAAQHGMIWVGNTSMSDSPTSVTPGVVNRLGSWVGLMTQSNNGESADTAPPEVDRIAAEYFGQRIAKITKQFKA